MNPVFGKDYSNSYDLLYEEKDYDGECNLIETILVNHSKIPVRTILDLGCGTGNHTLRLIRRGYDVTGVDISSEMLSIAKEKSAQLKIPHEFFQSDIREFDCHKKFDAVIMMFAVLGYQKENGDVLAALKTVSNHLKKGGVFICDVWYGPAVLSQKPGQKIRELETGGMKITRSSYGELDTQKHLVNVHFHLLAKKGDTTVTDIEEDHSMRFFFPQELAVFFENAGLQIIHQGSFPDYNEPLNEKTWNMTVIGQKS